MDTLKSGHPPYNGQTVRPLPIYCLPLKSGQSPKLFALCLYIVHTFLPPKKGQPLNNGQMLIPNVSIIQRLHCIVASSIYQMCVIHSTGVINSGRLVMALYLNYFVILKYFMSYGRAKLFSLLKDLIPGLVKYLVKIGLITWIIEVGGWVSVYVIVFGRKVLCVCVNSLYAEIIATVESQNH